MAPTRVGIIGLSADQSAWATLAHVGPLKSAPLSDKYEVVAVATSNPTSAKKAAEAHGVKAEKAYSNPEDIANDPDVDLVVVSVKTPLHKQLALPALHAKKDVYVEWPLGNGLKEAEDLASLAKKQGVRNAVGLQTRLGPSIAKAKEILKSGALGRILNSTMTVATGMSQDLQTKNAYINDPSTGANLVTIPTIHALDPLIYLLGEFKSLTATTATTFPDVQFIQEDGSRSAPVKRTFVDAISVQGILESGALVSFSLTSTSKSQPGGSEWIISGEKGALKFGSPAAFLALGEAKLYRTGGEAKKESFYAPEEGAKWEEVEFSSGAFGGIGEVYEALAEGRKGEYVDFETAVKRHKLVEAILRSAEKGTRESY